jgi:hypothetical protein
MKRSDDTLIANLRTLHQEIPDYRNGEWIDVDTELEKMREEQGYELIDLR